MNRARRAFIQRTGALGASLLALGKAFGAGHEEQMRDTPGMEHGQHPMSPPRFRTASPGPIVPVETPDVPDLPFELDNGVKVFHLIAEPVKQELVPDKIVNLWGYNGSAPGPTIQVQQGDRVRIIMDNHLPEPTSMHWHGFEIPFDMDGAPGLSQDSIRPGGRFVYEFTLHQEGTYFYHSHMAMQEMMGMIGAFIMHPKKPYDPPVDKDFAILLQEYAILPNNSTPNSMAMEFNWLTFNGKAGAAATPLIVRLGERVRIRLVNLGMDHHPIHLHGHQFVITGSEAGRQPTATWAPANTVLVGVAQARDVEFVANNPGNWMLHCHLPHHMMNQMSSMVGPMTRRMGMPAEASMDAGMGMPRRGNAMSEEHGPSLGRGMGVDSALEQATSNGPLSRKDGTGGADMASRPGTQGMVMQTEKAQVSQDANSVPGFPQDAFMEGPVMAMDEMYQKPENHGLRSGWSGFMQGMMTLVRVLPPDQYDRIMELRAKQGNQRPQMPNRHVHNQPGRD